MAKDLVFEKISLIIEQLENYSELEIQDSVKVFQKIKNSNYFLKNLKIKRITTNINQSENNPNHDFTLNGKNFWIKGKIGMGKTSFFDKIYDFFISPMKYGTPIKGWNNNSTLDLIGDDLKTNRLEIKSNSNEKTSQLYINNNINLLKLKELGLFENNNNYANMITQDPEDDNLFEHFQKLDHFKTKIIPYIADKRLNRTIEEITNLKKILTQKKDNLEERREKRREKKREERIRWLIKYLE